MDSRIWGANDMTDKIGCVQHDCDACATQAAELRRLQEENEALQQKVCDLRHKLETIKAHIQADCL